MKSSSHEPRGTDSARPFDFVQDAAGLQHLCAKLQNSTLLAVDTEFIGERTYYPQLELIQIADGNGTAALIDVPAAGDLAPLAEILTDPNREKIFHSAGQDVLILERALGAPPFPMFDTQLAAAMTGFGMQISYANLVRACLDAVVDKDHTASDWSHRPLSTDQLDYAYRDVEFLHALRDDLLQRLEARGRVHWFLEEQEKRAAGLREKDTTTDDERFRQVKEWARLSERKLAILRALAAWRERRARDRNIPRKQVMADASLIGLAQIAPDKREDIQKKRQLGSGAVGRWIDELLPIIQEAKALPREQWPKKHRNEPPDIPTGFVELLQALVRRIAEEEDIAPQLLATTGELSALVNNRGRLDGLALPVLEGWRRELAGESLVELLEGRLSLRIVDGTHLRFDPVSNLSE